MELAAVAASLKFRSIAIKGANPMTIALIILVLLLIGAIPAWPYSRNWGPYPSGGLGLILLIVVVLMLLKVF